MDDEKILSRSAREGGRTLKIERSKEWWLRMAEREGDAPIAAGILGGHMRTMRQARLDLSTPIEQKLREALRAIEEGPADVRLTKASTLVSEALEQIGDYIDEQLRVVDVSEFSAADASRYQRGVTDGKSRTPPTEASTAYLRGYIIGKQQREP